VVGTFGDLLSIISVAAPLSVLGLVIRTKSVEYLPLPLCVNNLLNSCAWGTFAIFKKDIYVGVSVPFLNLRIAGFVLFRS
jgi:solute carrier family 50 protein (sugar transporter)